MSSPARAKSRSNHWLENAYLTLVQHWSLWQENLDQALKYITEYIATSVAVERASIWQIEGAAEARKLTCLDLYRRSAAEHRNSLQLAASRYPAYFDALDQGRIIDAHDAGNDIRTREFRESYLRPLGIGAMLDATLRRAGATCGVVCVEHVGGPRLWSDQEQTFLLAVADLVSQLLLYHEVRENEHRYRTLFDSAGDAIFVMQGDRCIDCNIKALEMFGCQRSDFIDHVPFRLSPPVQPDGRDSEEKALEKIGNALSGDQQFFDWQHWRLDGTIFDAEITLTRLELRGQAHVLALVRDASERKRVERALLYSEASLRERTEHLQLLNDLAARLQGTTDVEHIAQQATHALLRLSEAPSVAFLQLADDVQQLHTIHAYGLEHGSSGVERHKKCLGDLAEIALAEPGITLFSERADEPPFPREMPPQLVMRGYRAGLAIPLTQEHQTLGLIFLCFRNAYSPTASELETFRTFGKTVSLSMANARQVNKLIHQANHDPLTGLPNRQALHDYCAGALPKAGARGEQIVLCLLDLNRFKEINDTLGHQVGDKALIHVAECLREPAGECRTTAYRLGGDEFAILIEALSPQGQFLETVETLLNTIRKPFDLGGIRLEVGGSLGVALFPDHGSDSHELLRCADVAMYCAKAGIDPVRVYDARYDVHTPERLVLMQDLGAAVRDNQLLLHYQPKVNLRTGRVSGCEALLRWRHPRLGLIPPEQFIPLAEMGDLIGPLTDWVLGEALRTLRGWYARDTPLEMSVNLSPRNLLDRQCPSRLSELLGRHPVPAGSLELEITESALMDSPELALEQARKFTAMGIQLSLDDFGTGYSSLAHLKQLQPHVLKIDRSFIRDLRTNEADLVIVRSTIAMAQGLGLTVLAEGVEDQATMEALRDMGCDQAQGYHIGLPMTESNFLAWLEGKPRKNS